VPETRIAFADTNWLVSVYHTTQDTPRVREWAGLGLSTVVVSSAVLLESQCAFWRLGDRWPALQSDLRSRRWVDCGQTFEALAEMASPLFKRYAPKGNVGALDVLHVAAAKRFGCRWFLSFDRASGCRAMAECEGLKVFPPVNKTDRSWLSRFRGRRG
jgi:predicted nucleic acid-binding protein